MTAYSLCRLSQTPPLFGVATEMRQKRIFGYRSNDAGLYR